MNTKETMVFLTDRKKTRLRFDTLIKVHILKKQTQKTTGAWLHTLLVHFPYIAQMKSLKKVDTVLNESYF